MKDRHTYGKFLMFKIPKGGPISRGEVPSEPVLLNSARRLSHAHKAWEHTHAAATGDCIGRIGIYLIIHGYAYILMQK